MISVHEADAHAPYAHWLITPDPRGAALARKGKRVPVQPETPPLVVCAFCYHWDQRPLKGCNCIASCHAESIASTSGNW